MKYLRVVVTHYGGPVALMAREGIHPETPPLPYTPGWDLVGE